MAWLSGYKYRKAFTIDKTKIGTGTHSLFTAYVPIADDAGFGAHAKADGTDVCWTKADGTTLLNFQRRAFAVAGGLATGSWEVLLADDISSAANPLIYAYYGDADAADLSDPDGAWNANVVGAWYLDEAASTEAGNYKDSSANGNHGTLQDFDADTTSVAGKIGNCVNFNGDTDVISCGSGVSLDNIRTLTIEVWAKADVGKLVDIVNKGDATGWRLREHYGFGECGFIQYRPSIGHWKFPLNLSALVHIALTYDATSVSNDPLAFVNGESVVVTEIATPSGDPSDDSAEDFFIGGRSLSAGYWDGLIDEVRVHNVIRSEGWLKTRYNNESSPLTFVLLGDEEEDVDREGGSESSVVVSGEGGGEKSAFGGSESSVAVSSEGEGEKNAFGGSEARHIVIISLGYHYTLPADKVGPSKVKLVARYPLPMRPRLNDAKLALYLEKLNDYIKSLHIVEIRES